MSELLNDWCDFCEGNSQYDISHFLTLFHGEVDPQCLRRVFQYFPNEDELVERLTKVKAVYPGQFISDTFDHDQLLAWAHSDLKEKAKACDAMGESELVDIMNSASVNFIEDFGVVEGEKNNDWPHGELIVVLSDYFSLNRVAKETKYYALFEAFYGLAANFHIQWYLGSPLINTDINVDAYFNLWRVGGDYALTESALLVGRQS